MGLIKSIFGTIFGLLGGIFKAVAGLVSGGKKSEFFLELEEAVSDSLPSADPAPAAKAEPVAAAPAKAATKTPAKTQAPAAPAAPALAPVATTAIAPAPTGFASNYLTSVGTAMPRRRRPGPSLSPFMDMAKQVKAR
ncbi:hypothetical protein [Nodosilinea sp. E11]|uniref:hypothetical protein n=1 Tax=Nodosilinea sp. E11 TaxID=3037479 RepID=UPI002934E03C|nr:hypothetical protein [Nodosilinea sp. E11]WOD37687.1 hypothetical protein RRF56_15870 [Nodosilinea sp. E11]